MIVKYQVRDIFLDSLQKDNMLIQYLKEVSQATVHGEDGYADGTELDRLLNDIVEARDLVRIEHLSRYKVHAEEAAWDIYQEICDLDKEITDYEGREHKITLDDVLNKVAIYANHIKE